MKKIVLILFFSMFLIELACNFTNEHKNKENNIITNNSALK